MYGGSKNNEKDNKAEEGEGSGGWASTFFKVAGAVAATAAIAGSIYGIAKQAEAAEAEAEQGPKKFPPLAAAPFGVQQPFHYQEEVILKVDGSFLSDRLSAGCGGFLSSASEKWICGFSQKLLWNPNLTDNETEREAILRGLLWVKGKGKKKVVVKTDNKGNADLTFLSSSATGGRSTDPVICGIRDLLNSDQWEASLSWISGVENAVADRLAHKAHSFTSYDLQEIDCPPQNCLRLL
ncbi:hypothetical protein P8452_10047 [Trifolium repens]|nr:hypothetical protein P8452_10047 [Trifolium repens]